VRLQRLIAAIVPALAFMRVQQMINGDVVGLRVAGKEQVAQGDWQEHRGQENMQRRLEG
jgi:hypothetical protein